MESDVFSNFENKVLTREHFRICVMRKTRENGCSDLQLKVCCIAVRGSLITSEAYAFRLYCFDHPVKQLLDFCTASCVGS